MFCASNITLVQHFIVTYQRFDGIILPEHIKEPAKSQYSFAWFRKEDPTMCNSVKLSSFGYKTDDLKIDNHKELRKEALNMHLQSIHDNLVGTGSVDDPVYCVEVVCAIYLSLHKYYVCYVSTYGYLGCHDWEFTETTKVRVVLVIIMYVCVCISCCELHSIKMCSIFVTTYTIYCLCI